MSALRREHTFLRPQIGGIDLQYAVQCRLGNVFINTDTYNVHASQPTHGTEGLITLAYNSAALTILRNVTITDGDNNIYAQKLAELNRAAAKAD